MCGYSVSIGEDTVEYFKRESLPRHVKGYNPKDKFNA
jgi:hypothetical protein